MNGIPPQLQKRIDEGYAFNFGDYISKGIRLIQQEVGLFIGAILLFFVIQIVLSAIPIVGGLVSGLFVSPIILVAFYITGHKLDKGEKIEFSDFFRGYDKIGDLALTALLTGLIVLGSIIPGCILLVTAGISSYYTFEPDFDAVNGGLLALGLILILIPAVYFSVSYTWALPLVWFYDIKPWPAMETSRKLVGRNWFMVFLFLMVTGLIAALGVLGFFIGLLFTIPVMYLAHYAAFADVTGLLEEYDETTDQSDIIDHFVPAG
jgi:uncharacterized membrane protein